VNSGSLCADDCMRTVCFVARADFESMPGGDTMQWRMYERVVREAGLRATTWFDDSLIPPADVYHAFNVDRPLELYPKLAEVKRRGRPFILSTIHHPNEWMTKYSTSQLSAGALGSLLYRSALGRSMPARETIREIAKVARDRRIARLLALVPSWRQRVRWLLGNADRIMLLTGSEATYVQTDFAYEIPRHQKVIVPNWSEGLGDASAGKPDAFAGLPEPPVLVVGRIEPRKGNLRISRLAERARRHVVFVGPALNGDGAFARAFHVAVQRSQYSTWIPGVPRSMLAAFYRHSSFLLNLSFVEVSPLVDVEALALGCPVSTTMYAMHHQLLPPDTPLCDPYDDHSILDRLQWRPGRLPPRQLVDREMCARRLVDTYLALAHASDGSGDQDLVRPHGEHRAASAGAHEPRIHRGRDF
jgi:glycosyltransferase involved in cell wall biosynthesis